MPYPLPNQDISPGRKAAYYTGLGLTGLGLLTFLSVFVSGALHFGDFGDFEARGRSMALRGVGGMALMILGGVLAGVGRGGLAGSGLLLDPEQARDDLEPWARTSGRLTDDAFSEMRTVREAIGSIGRGRGGEGDAPDEGVKVRCRECRALNDEADRYCGQCGKPL